MRKVLKFNTGWTFYKDISSMSSGMPEGEAVDLPHTYNGVDGQDGGGDYYRGKCLYKKSFSKSELPRGELYYIEIGAANSAAEVFLNGKSIVTHKGGYSLFRGNLTEQLKEDNELIISVDNSHDDSVYPAMADFTFYGGLYRYVKIIAVNKTHFCLDYYGGSGLMVTPRAEKDGYSVEMEAFVDNFLEGDEISFRVADADGKIICSHSTKERKHTVYIDSPRLWQGIADPYLYKVQAVIMRDGREIDGVEASFGCRSFKVDPERGFFLNGKSYPLRGVSRHQDRPHIGNALRTEHHREDMDLIREIGANTIRLAHYQHDAEFYDLCDRYGMVVWAEIPYISKHSPEGRENTVSQLTELIVQNYNHPSICFWGLSNEITMSGASDPDLIENHKILNALAHKLDNTRLTAIACITMCDIDEEYVHIPDTVAYNHYFGWYGGDVSQNGPWFDSFHEKYPITPIGISEYGAEALDWHSPTPKQGDYTEEYQAYYHERMLEQISERPYLFATYVWNMFDFGADARMEGGDNGKNHKGLVTFDRKYKKDSFYIYKAYLSDEPFVHICGKRYVNRFENPTRIKVYSNLNTVELFYNGISLGEQTSKNHVFSFDVPNGGDTLIRAVSGGASDECVIKKVNEPDQSYVMKEQGAVLNWFDVETPEGRFSLNDTLEDIMTTVRGKLWVLKMGRLIKKRMSGGTGGFGLSEEMLKMMGGFTVLRLTGLMGAAGVKFSKEELLRMNSELNKIKKPKG